MEKQIEAKFVLRPPDDLITDDIHIVKEIVTENDIKQPNLRIIKDFNRSVWITKPEHRNHKQKKESEDISKLMEIKTTQKKLVTNVVKHLDKKYHNKTRIWDIIDSPYIYGLDIDSRAVIKHIYQDKFGENTSPYSLTTFDIESNTDTGEIIIISIATRDKVYVTILDKLFKDKTNVIDKLKEMFKQYIPDSKIFKDIEPEFELCSTEQEVITKVFDKLHSWKTDFIAVWNINYDIPQIIERCNVLGIDLARLFSSPDVPDKYKYFKYKQDNALRVTESGVHKPKSPEEQWHTVQTPSYSYWIDAMAAHRFIRVGGKATPGGYALDNILGQELGSSYKKLKFNHLEDVANLTGIDWHKQMVNKYPLEYVIYNCWDTMSMIELDAKTTDLEVNLPILAGISSYDVFNSGPKKIIDIIHYFYLNHNRVLGCKPRSIPDSKTLPLADWISILESIYVRDDKGKYLVENKDLTTNIRKETLDLDAVSSYPSDILAANVSKDTTHREIIDIEGIDRLDFMRQNINLFFGKVNHVEYCTTMLNFPTLQELGKKLTDSYT